MINFPIALNDDSDILLYEQLAAALRDGIKNGLLASGERLPSTRELAARLGVSKKTVTKAYEVLQAQGMVHMEAGKTTVANVMSPAAAPDASPVAITTELDARISSFAKQLTATEPVGIISGFNSGAAAAAHIPFSQWKRYLSAHLKDNSPILHPNRDPLGYAQLRSAIADYLGRLHGITCDASQVAILSEARQGIELVAKLFLNAGDRVVVENPGSRWARRIFRAYGATVEPVQIDEDGLQADRLNSLADGVKLLYVTPSHHDPTGAVLSLARRQALVNWANNHNVLVIEDHTDSQYRYTTRPIPALQAFDKNNSVVYLSTFWKVMFPVLKLGFAVLPKTLTSLVVSARGLAERDSLPSLEQYALADFIKDGQLERHIKRMGKIYFQRRHVLMSSLLRQFGKRVHVAKESAGLQQHIKFNFGMADDVILECAEEAKFPLISLAPFYLDEQSQGEFLVPFALLEENQLEERIVQFANNIEAADPNLRL